MMRLLDSTIVKFIMTGCVNTLFGAAIMFFLYNVCNAGYWASSVISYIAGSILSFFLNKYFTFAVKTWTVFMVTAFIINISLSYIIAYGLAKQAMHYLLRESPQNIRDNLALMTGMCLFTGINYTGQRFIVFKKDHGGI